MDNITGYSCKDGTCVASSGAEPPYPSYEACTKVCRPAKRQTLWIILAVLLAVLLAILIWTIVSHVLHSRRYRPGKVMSQMRSRHGIHHPSLAVPATVSLSSS